MRITFRLLAHDDLRELRSWFQDEELSRRLSFPTDEWFAYVTNEAAVRCWLALEAGEIVALLQVDGDDAARGYLDLAVRPQLRQQGYGAAVLASFLSGPGTSYALLEGRIAPDNLASLACCRGCGFEISPEPDADGFLRALYRSP
ncbi:GNAT family N-acetyltransferase [Rhizobium wuzhouense]|uniref:N-acetyltransferase domain-containing protein n=1 Tax=Rhizobium wuzhouense TaxID=1986026 RepID=A0ABX5NQ80_9HYPH|nr:GNAT family N-acetyltransferase [Rhizobium wuzhouense]PYB70650.1 hypothetical protein DMY87_19385 [Rhizobium wuzhouense]